MNLLNSVYHCSYDNKITQRREVIEKSTGKVINFISREFVDAMQGNGSLKGKAYEAGAISLNPWGYGDNQIY